MTKTPRTDEVGRRYGRLLVLGLGPTAVRTLWVCVCDCGTFKIVDGAKLRNGHTQSCGCLRQENAYRLHGHSAGRNHKASPTYVSWASMLTRCNNPSSEGYSNYGAKGVKVCGRWESFSNFLTDMGERPCGTSLERLDNAKDYEPENCTWASRLTQARNRKNCLTVEYQGQIKSLAEWCSELKLNYAKAYHVVRTQGQSLECAIAKQTTL